MDRIDCFQNSNRKETFYLLLKKTNLGARSKTGRIFFPDGEQTNALCHDQKKKNNLPTAWTELALDVIGFVQRCLNKSVSSPSVVFFSCIRHPVVFALYFLTPFTSRTTMFSIEAIQAISTEEKTNRPTYSSQKWIAPEFATLLQQNRAEAVDASQQNQLTDALSTEDLVSAQKSRVPPNYVCHRCGKGDHFIHECKTNGDSAYDGKPARAQIEAEKAEQIWRREHETKLFRNWVQNKFCQLEQRLATTQVARIPPTVPILRTNSMEPPLLHPLEPSWIAQASEAYCWAAQERRVLRQALLERMKHQEKIPMMARGVPR